ncbi:MAG: hypothetical protein OXB84_03285 [Halobacteriovoraceae bacterium]|nr:hypothetical protein [Halobacteriovoraceae bacterium]
MDSMKIPTKRQGRGWHNYTIIHILKRERVYVSKVKKPIDEIYKMKKVNIIERKRCRHET